MIDPVSTIESTFGITLKTVSRFEYRSLNGCPFCGDSGKGDKSDRFRVFTNEKPRYWCRKCGTQGIIASLLQSNPLTYGQRRLAQIEAEQRRLAQQQQDHERRLSALEQMAKSQDHIKYHKSLNEQSLEYWFSEGMTAKTIDRYLLGYCDKCPTYPKSPSYTIPVINRDKLENIRHRLSNPNGTGKYRPHLAGLGNSLFNVDLLDQAKERIIIVEGSKKSIILAQCGFLNVGITGKRAFKTAWLPWFDHIERIIVCLDPDAIESAFKLARVFGERARVTVPPVKIDDAIVKHSAGYDDIEGMFQWARSV
jgi:hypothetical protein